MENDKTHNNEVIDKLKEYINFIAELIENMCSYIYSGEGNKIFNDLDEFINGLDFILSKSNYIDENIDIKQIDVILTRIEKAISIKDYVLLADVFIYELKPILQKWIETIEIRHGNL